MEGRKKGRNKQTKEGKTIKQRKEERKTERKQSETPRISVLSHSSANRKKNGKGREILSEKRAKAKPLNLL